MIPPFYASISSLLPRTFRFFVLQKKKNNSLKFLSFAQNNSLFIAVSKIVSIFIYISTFMIAARFYNFFVNWNSCPDSLLVYRSVYYGYSIVSISTATLFYCLAIPLDDIFHIKREMAIEFFVNVSVNVILIAANFFLEPYVMVEPLMHAVRVGLLCFNAVFCQILIGVIPVVRSLYYKNECDASDVETMAHTMQDEDLRELFSVSKQKKINKYFFFSFVGFTNT